MNISVGELLVVLVVALLVIKPERLPEVAEIVGRFVQWVRSVFSHKE